MLPGPGGRWHCHRAGTVGQADCADAGDAESVNKADDALRRQVGVVDG